MNDGSGAAIAEQLLLIIEAVLLEASALATSQGVAQEMPTLSEEQAHLTMLLDFIESPYVVRKTKPISPCCRSSFCLLEIEC